MLFLIWVAQMQASVEKLATAHLFFILAHCKYIDSQPQVDQAFIGVCSYLFAFTQILTPPFGLLGNCFCIVVVIFADTQQRVWDAVVWG